MRRSVNFPPPGPHWTDYSLGARYYDPHLGIWASPDGALQRLMREPKGPEMLWLYTYASNNAVVRFDPNGLEDRSFFKSLVPPQGRLAYAAVTRGWRGVKEEAAQITKEGPGTWASAASPVTGGVVTTFSESVQTVRAGLEGNGRAALQHYGAAYASSVTTNLMIAGPELAEALGNSAVVARLGAALSDLIRDTGGGSPRAAARILSDLFGKQLGGELTTLERAQRVLAQINTGTFKAPAGLTRAHLDYYEKVATEAIAADAGNTTAAAANTAIS